MDKFSFLEEISVFVAFSLPQLLITCGRMLVFIGHCYHYMWKMSSTATTPPRKVGRQSKRGKTPQLEPQHLCIVHFKYNFPFNTVSLSSEKKLSVLIHHKWRLCPFNVLSRACVLNRVHENFGNPVRTIQKSSTAMPQRPHAHTDTNLIYACTKQESGK